MAASNMTTSDALAVKVCEAKTFKANIKETFWTTQLGIQFADDKIKEVEISDNKAKFLRRIIEANKAKVVQPNPMGGQTETTIELFFPYELGQLLAIFATDEEKKEFENE